MKTNLKYRFWLLLLFSMASRDPMPRYFLSLTPSEKKYSPGASVVAASREPIITTEVEVEGSMPPIPTVPLALSPTCPIQSAPPHLWRLQVPGP